MFLKFVELSQNSKWKIFSFYVLISPLLNNVVLLPVLYQCVQFLTTIKKYSDIWTTETNKIKPRFLSLKVHLLNETLI